MDDQRDSLQGIYLEKSTSAGAKRRPLGARSYKACRGPPAAVQGPVTAAPTISVSSTSASIEYHDVYQPQVGGDHLFRAVENAYTEA